MSKLCQQQRTAEYMPSIPMASIYTVHAYVSPCSGLLSTVVKGMSWPAYGSGCGTETTQFPKIGIKINQKERLYALVYLHLQELPPCVDLLTFDLVVLALMQYSSHG